MSIFERYLTVWVFLCIVSREVHLIDPRRGALPRRSIQRTPRERGRTVEAREYSVDLIAWHKV
jgi:hypothetical protein